MIAEPIPFRMAKLDRDKRGYPVPVIVVRDREGLPHFAVNDIDEMNRLDKSDGCPICGMKLMRGRWLIGGGLSAFADQGWFADGPAHYECAHYALKVCPYLAAQSYGRINKGKALARAGTGIGFDIDVVDPNRPFAFVAMMSVAIETNRKNVGTWVYRPRDGSIRRIDVWRHGQLLNDDELAAFKAHIKATLAANGWAPRADVREWIG